MKLLERLPELLVTISLRFRGRQEDSDLEKIIASLPEDITKTSLQQLLASKTTLHPPPNPSQPTNLYRLVVGDENVTHHLEVDGNNILYGYNGRFVAMPYQDQAAALQAYKALAARVIDVFLQRHEEFRGLLDDRRKQIAPEDLVTLYIVKDAKTKTPLLVYSFIGEKYINYIISQPDGKEIEHDRFELTRVIHGNHKDFPPDPNDPRTRIELLPDEIHTNPDLRKGAISNAYSQAYAWVTIVRKDGADTIRQGAHLDGGEHGLLVDIDHKFPVPYHLTDSRRIVVHPKPST